MIDTILLDLDDTILDFHMAERVALSRTLRGMGIEPTEEILNRYNVLNASQWRLLEQGIITRDQVKLRRYELLFEEFDLGDSAEQAAAIYEELLGEGHYFIDGAEEMLKELSTNYRLYIVTNGTASVQKSRVASAGIGNYFAGMFISEEMGYDKPSRTYFDLCFGKIPDFNKENTIIVGDSPTSDMRGGHNADIRTVWFNKEGIHKFPENMGFLPDYEIHRLEELKELLKKI